MKLGDAGYLVRGVQIDNLTTLPLHVTYPALKLNPHACVPGLNLTVDATNLGFGPNITHLKGINGIWRGLWERVYQSERTMFCLNR